MRYSNTTTCARLPQEDIERACELLSEAEEADTIPPYERPIVSDRVTQVLERLDPEQAQWGAFRRWQAERADEEQTRRMMRR